MSNAGSVSSPAPTTIAPEKVRDPGRVCARNGNASRLMPPFPAGSITVMPRSVAMEMAICTERLNSTRMSGVIRRPER